MLGIVIGLWYLVTYAILDEGRRFLMPAPHRVVTDGLFGTAAPSMWEALGRTTTVALTGLAIAAVIGIVWAVVMSQSRMMETALFPPYAVVLQCIPILALVPPLVGFWFGFGFSARVFVCVLIALFPIVSNTLFGLRSVDRQMRDLFALHHPSRLTVLRKLEFPPAAMPAIFAGLRISAGLSVVGAIVGDFFFKQGEPPRHRHPHRQLPVTTAIRRAVRLHRARVVARGSSSSGSSAGSATGSSAAGTSADTPARPPRSPARPARTCPFPTVIGSTEKEVMNTHVWRRLSKPPVMAVAAAVAFTAACGSDDTAESSGYTGPIGPVDLSANCPDKVVIQTDWNPEAEHGHLYQLLGPDPVINAGNKRVTGPLFDRGQYTGVDVEIRAGGPAIGFQSVTSQMYSDPEILLGYVDTDQAIQNSESNPTVAVMAPLDISPQMIMWDPATYPQVKGIGDLKPVDARVLYFEGATYMDYLTGSGVLSPDQVDGSYDGTPANFVAAGGKTAQQGYASSEPPALRGGGGGLEEAGLLPARPRRGLPHVQVRDGRPRRRS